MGNSGSKGGRESGRDNGRSNTCDNPRIVGYVNKEGMPTICIGGRSTGNNGQDGYGSYPSGHDNHGGGEGSTSGRFGDASASSGGNQHMPKSIGTSAGFGNSTGINSSSTPNFCSLSSAPNVRAFDSYVLQKHGAALMGSNGRHDFHASGNNLAMHELLCRANNASTSGWGANGMIFVKAITLYDNNIKDFDIDYMRSVLCNFVLNLDALYLHRNQISDNGVTHLLSGLINAPAYRNVVHLNLSENQISDNGAQMLAYYIGKGEMPKLKVLHLENNKLSPTGEGFLVKALLNKVVQNMIITTKRLEQNSKLLPGVGTKEEKIAMYREYLKKGIEKGTNDQAIVVDKSFWGKVEHTINQFKAASMGVGGFIKCNWQPDEVIESYAQEKFTAKISKTLAKVWGQLNVVDGVVSCYLEAVDEMYTSEPGQHVITHKLDVMGESEFSGDQ